MKVETVLFLVVFIFATLLCLAYNQEGFASKPDSTEIKTTIQDNETIAGLDGSLKKISDFANNLHNIDRSKVSSETLDNLSGNLVREMNGIKSQLGLLISKINQKENTDQAQTSIKNSQNLADSADVKASQILQDAHIQKLKDRLTRLQTNFGKYLQNKNEKKYPKIPIYSSCVISEAGGTYSLDADQVQGKGGPKTMKGDQKVVPGTQVYNPFKEMAQDKEKSQDESISLEDILKGLSQKNVEINFSIPEPQGSQPTKSN